MRTLLFFSRVCRRLKLSHLVYRMLSPLFKASGEILDDCNNEEILENFSPDRGHSVLCENQIMKNPTYDLQVIIPVYNVKEYLLECVNSVVKQRTNYSVLVVLVDDGSIDGSGQLADEIVEREMKNEQHKGRVCLRVIHQENRGLSGARNAGLRQIDARYILFLDADDVLADDAISKMLNTAKDENADIVGGGYYSFSNDGKTNYINIPLILTGFAWGKIYKAEIWKNICFPENYLYEDTICSMIAFRLAKKINVLPVIVCGYRKNPSSITHTISKNKKILDLHWITKRILSEREKVGVRVDDSCYEEFLRQVRFNTNHIMLLENSYVSRALLVESRELMNNHFCGSYTSIDNVNMEYALRKKNYSLFVLEALFNC